jgi:hypothetical protein
MPQKAAQIYQIKVTLDGIHPPIGRRILVPGNITLLKLHDILQIVMGWEDYHLHMFTIEGSIYGNPRDDEYGDLGTLDEASITLNQVVYGEKQRFTYEYDFGDSWDHTLLVEKISSPEEGIRYPVCLKGKRACPPEDVGGMWGYENFLEAIRDPNHDEHEEYLMWVGGEFDPETFDLEKVNAQLHSMGRGRSTEARNFWSPHEDMPEPGLATVKSSWMQSTTEEHRTAAENLPLRRDMVTLLLYLKKNKVTGTQSTGNLPLKAVREISAQFIDPPKLDDVVGEHVFRVRSETEVWPLHFRHILASVAGMIIGGLGKRWVLTSIGEQFLTTPALEQVWILFTTWWTKTNWAIAFPYSYGDGFMPFGFSDHTIKHLLDLPTSDPAPFEPFADQMITAAKLVWPIQNQETAHGILHALIERVVVNPMIDFGVIQAEYGPHEVLGERFRALSKIKMTSFGRSLLESMSNSRNS